MKNSYCSFTSVILHPPWRMKNLTGIRVSRCFIPLQAGLNITIFCFILLSAVFLASSAVLYAQWSHNPNVNTPISLAVHDQRMPVIVSDGARGAIIVWEDWRGADADIHAQRVNASGAVLWTANGVAICTADYDQRNPIIVSDGAGGAIITWEDWRNGFPDIYVQRVNANGVRQWIDTGGDSNGVAICTAANMQDTPSMVSDGAGGAIITWNDYRNFIRSDIYAQNVNADGERQWIVSGDSNGVAICNTSNTKLNPTITSDGVGGAIITWYEGPVGPSPNYDIYAQRVNASGVIQWTTNGIPVSTAANNQSGPTIISDGAGGAIIGWRDTRSEVISSEDIYVQRVNANGVRQWIGTGGDSNGVAICTATNYQVYPTIVSDSAGGGIIVWFDLRNGNYDIYAQSVNASGAAQWVTDGVAICTATNDQTYPTIISDGFRGAIIAWFDLRNGTNYHIYAQKVDSLGAVQWVTDGVTISTAPIGQLYPTIVSDGAGGAIITWYDNRNVGSTDLDIYAQWVNSNGLFGTQHAITALANPNGVIIPSGTVYVYEGDNQTFTITPNTGYHIDSIVVDEENQGAIGSYIFENVTSSHGIEAYYSINMVSTVTYGVYNRWNMVSVPMTVADYAKTTLFPTSVSSAYQYNGSYQVQSTLENGRGYWLKFSGDQNIDMSGFLLHEDTINVTAGWNMIGSISEAIPTANVSSNPGGMVTSQFYGYAGSYVASSTIEPGKAYWVKVNQPGQLILSSSIVAPANRVSIVETKELPPPSPDEEISNLTSHIPHQFSLKQNYPNPFNPSTVIKYDLPERSRVILKVYDLLGREVAVLVDDMQDAGYKEIEWNASEIPSGVYFYRLTSNNFTALKKMVVLK